MALVARLVTAVTFIGCVGATTQTIGALDQNPPGSTGVTVCDISPETVTVVEPGGVSYLIYPEDFREAWPDGGSRPVEPIRP
jgi:hypothetical protein